MPWRPSATLETLKVRARMLQRLRAFFAERNVLEVETPILSRAAATDPHLTSLRTRYTGPGHPNGESLYLHTSPEFPMKRLLAAGAESIFQVCKVFRDGERGRRHNPEFTMLEWYRVGFDEHRLMDEVADLVEYVTDATLTRAGLEKLTYRDAFMRYAGLDPYEIGVDAFADAARKHGITAPPGMPSDDLDPWRDLILTHVVEPNLGQGRLTFMHDYPASQAALARIKDTEPACAARFELYSHGLEIANGFHELADETEQQRRFQRDMEYRRRNGLPAVPEDRLLLAALHKGLPDCAGVALGFDRLVMVATGARSIDEVIAFPSDRA